jgi:5'-3' exonuclease
MEEVFPIKNFPIPCYRLYKAIRGDSSDNIPGIKLFGDKKIQAFFDTFKDVSQGYPTDVEALYNAFDAFPELKKKYWKYFDGQKERLEMNYKLVDLIDMDWSPQSLQLIYSAIESKPSFSAMDFMQILIKENINTILAKVQDWMKPFHQMLPEKK